MRKFIYCSAILTILLMKLTLAKDESDPNGYLVYCPCMGEYRQTPLPPPSLSLSERNLF